MAGKKDWRVYRVDPTRGRFPIKAEDGKALLKFATKQEAYDHAEKLNMKRGDFATYFLAGEKVTGEGK